MQDEPLGGARPKPFVAVNLLVRFLTEIVMLVALGWIGAEVGSSTAVSIVLAVLLPLAAASVWGLWIAPKAPRRLPDPARLSVEILLFAAAVVGLVVIGQPLLAAGFAIVVAANITVLRLSGVAH